MASPGFCAGSTGPLSQATNNKAANDNPAARRFANFIRVFLRAARNVDQLPTAGRCWKYRKDVHTSARQVEGGCAALHGENKTRQFQNAQLMRAAWNVAESCCEAERQVFPQLIAQSNHAVVNNERMR